MKAAQRHAKSLFAFLIYRAWPCEDDAHHLLDGCFKIMRTLTIITSWLSMLLATAPAQADRVPDIVRCAVSDRQMEPSPAASHFNGFLGSRLDANAFNRLLKLDEDTLLAGFRHRPGKQAWDGEHVGKWLHAATLAWAYTQDPRLREKLDRVVVELGKCQLNDGYLGTYLPDKRWTDWDVWAHKYDMIGLLTYYRFTGEPRALEMSRRCADLLCRTFGTEPGQKNILEAGWHMGMAPTSVLEPMVLLYRLTGDQKYLEFCRYILDSWETPKGPHIISTLLSQGRVDKVGNAKAYEMLSCLNGALEFYRTTGDPQILQAALDAWQDIVDKRLYITGTASQGEHFHGDYELPNCNAKIAETCVTVTWIQFNAQLLRLTGEARFAEQLERSVYNQLFGAEKPDGTAWGYYVELEGIKPYSDQPSGNCCLSSGPRGVALIPTFALTTDDEGIVVNFLNDGHSELRFADGSDVVVETKTEYPADGRVRITLKPQTPKTFTVKLRIPGWSTGATIAVNGQVSDVPIRPGHYAALKRHWTAGDEILLNVPVGPRLILGEHSNAGKVAFAFGPLILAADDALNPETPIASFQIPSADLNQLRFQTQPAPAGRRTWPGAQMHSVQAVLTSDTPHHAAGDRVNLNLVSFALAGSTLAHYQVWFPLQPVEPQDATSRDTKSATDASSEDTP